MNFFAKILGNQPSKNSTNQTGRQKKFVHWKSAEPPSPPGKPILIPVPDQQPDAITIHWEKPQSDGGSPLIGYIIEHRRVGATTWIRPFTTLITSNETTIGGLEPGWKYQFRAIAENVVGRSQPSALSEPIPVSLQLRNANIVPKFITELKDVHAMENERLEMRVRIFGNPQPEISWFKDGFEIFSSRRIKIVTESDFSMLIIHQVALGDEGEIKCTATNRNGYADTSAKLIVEAPPKIRLPRNYEDGLIVEEDDVLKLKAGIAGQPFPAIIWSREGRVIPSGSKFEITTSDKHSILKIEKVKRIDRGEYSLRAVNKLGEDTASILVTVTARPRSPGKVRVVKSHGTSVTLAWNEPEDDGGCKIGSYIVEYFRMGWDVWLKATTTRQLQTTLRDLIEGSEYKFRVKAENPYGLSDPSPESDIFYLKHPTEQQKPTETTILISDNVKSLSPSKVIKSSDQSRSPIRGTSPTIRTMDPEVFESAQLNMEMSYGASVLDTNITNASKNVKTKEDRGTSPPQLTLIKQRSPIPAPRKSHTLSVDIKTASNIQQISRTPSPKIEISLTKDFEQDEQVSQEIAKHETEQQLKPKIKQPTNIEPKPVRRKFEHKSISSENIKLPPRPSTSTVPQNVSKKNIEKPEEKITETDLKIEERLKLEREKDEMKQIKAKSLEREREELKELLKTMRNSPNLWEKNDLSAEIQPQPKLKKSFEYLFNKMSNDENKEELHLEENGEEKLISNEYKDNNKNFEDAIQNDSTDQQLSSDAEGKHKDEIHTSNEYMIVFYPNGRAKNVEEPETRNFYHEDNQGPPAISYSFPNLSNIDELSFQASIRRSASSTELLYEKAMARFYEAVEMEEGKHVKKKTSHLGEHLIMERTTVQNLYTISHSEENLSLIEKPDTTAKESIEHLVQQSNVKPIEEEILTNKNKIEHENLQKIEEFEEQEESVPKMITPVNRRNLVELTQNLHVQTKAEIKCEDGIDDHEEKTYKLFSEAEVRENTRKNSLFNNQEEEEEEDLDYASDYTESTASDSESSMEYFRREIMSRSTSSNLEKRKQVTLSPVRYESEDDAVHKNRPLQQYSSSDSVTPKSILKKPASTENVVTPSKTLNNITPENKRESENKVATENKLNPENKLDSYTSKDTVFDPKPALKDPVFDLKVNLVTIDISTSNASLNSNVNPSSNMNSHVSLNSISSTDSRSRPIFEPKIIKTNANKLNPNDESHSNPKKNSKDTSKKHADNPKTSPLSKAKSGFKSFFSGGKSKKEKNQVDGVVAAVTSQDISPQPSEIPKQEVSIIAPKQEKKPSKQEPDEGAAVVVDYYSSIVEELGHSKYKTPLYLDTNELKKQSEKAELEESKRRFTSDHDDDEDLLLRQHLAKPRLSIVERMQTQHVRPERSPHCVDTKIVMVAPTIPETPSDDEITQPSFPTEITKPKIGGKKVVKVKKIIKKTARAKSRDNIKTTEANGPSSAASALKIDEADLSKLHELYQKCDTPTEEETSLEISKSQETEIEEGEKLDPEEITADAQELVHSAVSYLTDLGLFMFACWVYLFKDAYMVLPILALMVYRRIGEAISKNLPKFLRKKPS